jgi:helicase required for RNAi-mediated heterochromatin assembly 1
MTFADSIQDSEEVNPHLRERFGSASAPTTGNLNPYFSRAPTSRVMKHNNEIREYFEGANKPVAGGNWLQKPEFPTPSEIMSNPADHRPGEDIIDVTEELRPNKIEGAYESNEEYLGTQYDLLREDTVRPLREAVSQVRASPYLDEAEYTGSRIGIYDPVSDISCVIVNMLCN